LRTIVYGLAAGFLPFLFFKGGFANISQLLTNVGQNTEFYKSLSPIYRLGFSSQFFALTNDSSHTSMWLLFGIAVMIITAVSCLGLISRWKTAMFLGCSIIVSPVVCGYYCALYLFAPIILFLNEKEHDASDWLYLVLITLILNPFQFYYNTTPITVLISNSALLILYLTLLVEAAFASVPV